MWSPEQSYVLARSDDIHGVLEEWATLGLARGASVDVSATALGLRAWATHFADATFSVLQLRREGSLRTLLPLTSHIRRMYGVKLRIVASPGNYYWRFGYPIGCADVEGSVAALLEYLAARNDWDVLDLGPMLRSSPHATALLTDSARLGMHPHVFGRQLAPVVSVRGTWDAYYGGLSSNLREMIRRGERKLAREGRVSFVEYAGGPDLSERLREFYDLEASGWKGRQGTAIASDPVVEAFYTDLAHEAAREGALRLYALRVGDELVAGDYCVAHGDVIHMLKIAYDERRARCSPGQVIRKLALQRLFEQGDGLTYDLMTGGGDHADYKRRWANDGREYIGLRLFNPATTRGRIACTATAVRLRLGRWRPTEPPG